MRSDIFGAALAFAAGFALAGASYLFSRRVLRTKPDRYALSHTLKQIVQVLFLVALFVLGDRTPWDRLWLLVGGALGITLPMIWFTYRLVKFNDSLHTEESKKEDSSDG